MGFLIKTGGFMDEIRCDEQSYLIWKWHPKDAIAGNNNRENAVRWGSSLSVKDGSVAVFVHTEDGKFYRDAIKGPFQSTLETDNLPVIAGLKGLLYDGGTPFQAEVYFINLAELIQVRFGVPFFDVYDPRFIDFAVPVAVRGTISFKITDYEEFIKLHRLDTFDIKAFEEQIRDAVCRYVKKAVINLPTESNIPVIRIESKIDEINDLIEQDIMKRLKESFGVTVSKVDVGAIEIDKTSDGYVQLAAVTKDITTATIQAHTAAELEDYAERMRIQREESQYAQHKQTQTANFAAFQLDRQAEVGIAGAEALGQMGAGDANVGDNGGFNPAGMMAGMAVGSAVGQNIAGAMNGMMAGTVASQAGTIPPVPVMAYHVAINGQAAGPFDLNTLKQMALSGQLVSDSLVWKEGMAGWKQAGNVAELQSLFTNAVPPVPPIVLAE